MNYISKHTKLLLLGGIFIIGLYLYTVDLGKIPSGFYIDEALPGYNAYSVLSSLRDEYGKLVPLVFRFYGSFNPPLFTYLVVPSVLIFGLNVFAVRIVSALSGLLCMIPVFILLQKSDISTSKVTKYIGVFLFVISPWMILHSRVGYEITLALLIFSLGVYFLYKGLEKPRSLVVGLILLSISTYAAYAERFIVPIFILGFIVVFRNILKRSVQIKNLSKGLLWAALIQVPNFLLLFTPAFFPKSNLTSFSVVSAQSEKIGRILPRGISYVLALVREFFAQYLTYFSPRSLFFLPDPDLQRSMPELSVFYFWMVIPYLLGLYSLWKFKKSSYAKLVILLALVTPIPAAFTRDPFSTHRAIPLVLPLILIISLGVDRLLISLPRKFMIFMGLGLALFSLILLWRSYFILLPKERARVWGYGVPELVEEARKFPGEHIIVDQSRKKPLYIQLAFFLKYSPQQFQLTAKDKIVSSYYENVDFNPHYVIGNFETRNIDWNNDVHTDQILVGDEYAISDDQAKEHHLEKVFEIRSPVDEILFVGYKTNPQKKNEGLN